MNRFFCWFGLPGSLVLSLLMCLLSVVLAAVLPSVDRIIAVFGMIFWSLGDIILMNYEPVVSRLHVRGFAAGGVSFLIGHLFFITAFIVVLKRAGVNLFNAGTAAAGVMWAAACIILVILSRGKEGRDLLLLFCLYLFGIAAVCAFAFSGAVSLGGKYICAGIGGLSFFISDYIIGLNRICGIHFGNDDALIWTLYPIGVILVLIGV